MLEKGLALHEEAVMNTPQGVDLGGGDSPHNGMTQKDVCLSHKNNVKHCRKFMESSNSTI